MPKGGVTSLISVSAGIREDLDMFLKAFLNIKSQRFSDYKNLFKNRQMYQLHNGRSASAEIIEFNENLLINCLHFLEEEVSPGVSRCLEERLFGLYSLYTFFYIQAPRHVVKIRIDPDASRNFRQLTAFLSEQNIYDAYLVCLKLLEDKAFKYVAFIEVYDPSIFKQYGGEKKPAKALINLNDPLSRVKCLLHSNLFLKLKIIEKEYIRKRNGFPLPKCYDSCQEALEKVLESIRTTPKLTHLPTKMEKPKMSRAEIRERAYKSKVKLSRARRHYSTKPISLPTDHFDFKPKPEPTVKRIKLKTEKTETRKRPRAATPIYTPTCPSPSESEHSAKIKDSEGLD
uniref:Uncharacterized protein n=1 Tax=Caenorhabditis tropicalis TaxID=1561998 RepID=A0A1I7V403_9PELO